MEYRFVTADVFTDKRFGGNPLAVFPEAQGLDTAQMQAIAREMNLSETVFVLPPDDPAHACRLRIFTPARELPFAGHPTVGTAHVLASIGDIVLAGDQTRVVFEEGVGPVPVLIRAEHGRPVFSRLSTARLPEFGPRPPSRKDIAEMLSLRSAEVLVGEYGPEAVSCGVPFLFVPVRDREVLARARPAPAVWDGVMKGYWASDAYVFCLDPEHPGSHVRARMFAPDMGIVEDPATGAAVSALAGYLAQRQGRGLTRLEWVVEQGFEMGRPSLLHASAELADDKVTAIHVGGASVLVSQGVMRLN